MHRSWCVVTVAGLFLIAAALVGPGVPAAGAAGVPDAAIRVARFSVGGGALDVRLTGYAGASRHLVVPPGGSPTVEGYAALPPGPYVVTVRSGAAAPAVLIVDAQPGAAYTLGVVAAAGTVRALLIHDDLTAPSPGSGRVRLILAAARARQADVELVSGPVLVHDGAFAGVTAYHAVRAGTWRVAGSAASGQPLRTVATVSIAAGRLTSIVLFDGPRGRLAVCALADAAGPSRSPGGPVPAGGGGMAAVISGHGSGVPAAPIGSLALAVVFASWAVLRAVLAVRRRRRAAAAGGLP